jgi:hypothetical protein
MFATIATTFQFTPLTPSIRGQFNSFVPSARCPDKREIIREQAAFTDTDAQIDIKIREADGVVLRLSIEGRTRECSSYLRFFHRIVEFRSYHVELEGRSLVIWQADYGWRKIFEIQLTEAQWDWSVASFERGVNFDAEVSLPRWNDHTGTPKLNLKITEVPLR